MKLFNILKQLATPQRLHNWVNPNTGYEVRLTDANIPSDNYGGVRKFLATSSMTSNKPPVGDGHILNLDWDNGDKWSAQLAVGNERGGIAYRGFATEGWTQWYKVLSDYNTADWVVEQGTSSIWTWAKWNSGKSECWGTITQAITNWGTWGAWYQSEPAARANFPSGLFISTPTMTVNATSASGQGIAGVETYLALSKDSTPELFALRPTSGSTGNIWFHVIAIGNWK